MKTGDRIRMKSDHNAKGTILNVIPVKVRGILLGTNLLVKFDAGSGFESYNVANPGKKSFNVNASNVEVL